MGDDMKYSFAFVDSESEIKQLLAGCDLIYEDITPELLEHFLLKRDGARLIAVIGLEVKNQFALLRSLAVDAEYRNRGIATGLVCKIEDYAKSLNLESLYLLTMTAEDFFKKCGYLHTARDSVPAGIQGTAEFLNLCPASASCMVKHLNPD
jgi:amino-acid N-acetyltransferase